MGSAGTSSTSSVRYIGRNPPAPASCSSAKTGRRSWYDGWHSQVLHAGDNLELPAFGLSCPVEEVYRRTPLA